MSELRNYQRKGVEAMVSMPLGLPHFILGDAPGTGKTIMGIEALKAANCRNALISCPSIVKEQWARQMVAWGLCGEDEIQIAYGHDAEIDSRPYVIINYDIVRDVSKTGEDGTRRKVSSRNRKKLREKKWHAWIADECHALKNHEAAQTLAFYHKDYGIGNSCYWKWLLSGSLVPNKALELYSHLKCMFPGLLDPYNTFSLYVERYCGGDPQGRRSSNIPELTEKLQLVMLRRLLQDVWKECPPIIEDNFYMDVPFEQHPDWQGSAFMNGSKERRVVALAKIPYTVAYLVNRLMSGSGKIVVFTYHQEVSQALTQQLAAFNPALIYGGTSLKKREAAFANFTQNPHCRLLFLQIMSGGTGLDGLQHVCNEYVEAEPEWSPGREDQAGDRIRRLGQAAQTVLFTRLLASRSYEEYIYGRSLRKRTVIDVLLKPNGGSFIMPSIEDSLASIAGSLRKFEPLADIAVQLIQAAANGQQTPFVAAAPAPSATPVPALIQPAPIMNAPAATPPAPVATPNILPFAAPAAPSPAAPVAPPAPPAPTAPSLQPVAEVKSPERQQFEDQVLATVESLGEPAGKTKLHTVLTQFNVPELRLRNVPQESFPLFLQYMRA